MPPEVYLFAAFIAAGSVLAVLDINWPELMGYFGWVVRIG